jgi:hypothetical protein
MITIKSGFTEVGKLVLVGGEKQANHCILKADSKKIRSGRFELPTL